MFRISALALAFLSSQAYADFDWNITEANPFADVEFSDARGGDELTVNYVAAQKHTTVKIFDYDNCNSTDGLNAAITTTEVYDSRTADALAVPININQTALPGASSGFYEVTGTNNETATIKLCVRVDLYADLDSSATFTQDESINFFESKIEIEVDMKSGFSVVGVSTNRTEATETSKNASLDYEVDAFQCDSTGTDITGENKQYTQGDFLEICVGTESAGVKVANIIEMTLTGDDTFPSIASDATPSSLTDRTCDDTVLGGTAGCKVKTMLISSFFADANPSAINATGTAVMEFVRARRLSSFRGLQDGSDDAEFGVSVSLQPMNIDEETTDGDIDMVDSAAAAGTMLYAGVVSFAVAAMSFFVM